MDKPRHPNVMRTWVVDRLKAHQHDRPSPLRDPHPHPQRTARAPVINKAEPKPKAQH